MVTTSESQIASSETFVNGSSSITNSNTSSNSTDQSGSCRRRPGRDRVGEFCLLCNEKAIFELKYLALDPTKVQELFPNY